jgi:hypothetical protein
MGRLKANGPSPLCRFLIRPPDWQHRYAAAKLRGVHKHFPAVEELIREVEAKAADEPDTLALLVALIKIVIRSEVDPYLLNGVLVQGIASTVSSRIPSRRKRQVARETVRLLLERLQAGGAL